MAPVAPTGGDPLYTPHLDPLSVCFANFPRLWELGVHEVMDWAGGDGFMRSSFLHFVDARAGLR